jgi:creatinine amidohydrolase
VHGIYLAELTWAEAERALVEFPVVLLPLGARTKEHGLHLPLNNDWLIAEYLARRVAEVCKIVVLPTLQYGYYPAFLEYPGSISVRWEACRDTVVDIVQSLFAHGARRFYVLNTGISTNKPLRAAREVLAERGARLEFTDLSVAYEGLRQQVETQPAGSHADEIETSMMLYLAPDVVRMDRAEADIEPDRGPGGLTRDPLRGSGVYSRTGAYGDPTRASCAKGRVVVEGLVQYLVDYLRAFAAEPPPSSA